MATNGSEPLPMLTETLVFPVTSLKSNKIMQDYSKLIYTFNPQVSNITL